MMEARKKSQANLELGDLKGADWNPRKITPEAMAGLRESLKAFGDISGIVFNRRLGTLTCGHQRLEALKTKYGDGLVTCVQRDLEGKVMGMQIITPDGSIFNVRIVEWDDVTNVAANLAANSQLISGEFTKATGALADRVAGELPLLAKATRVDELFLPELKRPEAEDLVDGKKLGEEPQPELQRLDKNYVYVECYGQPERFTKLCERLKAAGKLKGPHEVDREWFESIVFNHLAPLGCEDEEKTSPQKRKVADDSIPF